MTLDEFRAEVAGWIGRPVADFECTAWVHEPGQRPRKCTLAEADALSVPRAEFFNESPTTGGTSGGDAVSGIGGTVVGDAISGGTPRLRGGRLGEAASEKAEAPPCTLHEVKVVYLLAQKILGFGGAVLPSTTGRSWNLYRDE